MCIPTLMGNGVATLPAVSRSLQQQCSKMTLGNFIVLDQWLSVWKVPLHTILSTKSVHNSSNPTGAKASLAGRSTLVPCGKLGLPAENRGGGGFLRRVHVSRAGTSFSFEINGLPSALQASSHCYPQKMWRYELSLPLLPAGKISHAGKVKLAHKPLRYC